jgi:pimeloyl-ACP methyl ester carboxylesterase
VRGFGATQNRTRHVVRLGEQAALGVDVVDLLGALALPDAVLAGFDWGARAACALAA